LRSTDPSPRRANRPSSQSIFETLEKIINTESDGWDEKADQLELVLQGDWLKETTQSQDQEADHEAGYHHDDRKGPRRQAQPHRGAHPTFKGWYNLKPFVTEEGLVLAGLDRDGIELSISPALSAVTSREVGADRLDETADVGELAVEGKSSESCKNASLLLLSPAAFRPLVNHQGPLRRKEPARCDSSDC